MTFLSTYLAQFSGGLTGPGAEIFNPGDCISTAGASLEGVISLILGFLTTLAGLAFLLYFVFAALQWTLAGGEQAKVDSAKKQMTNGAIGLIIIVISYGIIAVVGDVLGLEILNPAQTIQGLVPGAQDCGTPSN